MVRVEYGTLSLHYWLIFLSYWFILYRLDDFNPQSYPTKLVYLILSYGTGISPGISCPILRISSPAEAPPTNNFSRSPVYLWNWFLECPTYGVLIGP